MKITGAILKMQARATQPISYSLPIGDETVELNPLIGRYIILHYEREIYCIGCGRKTARSFAQGYCYPCLLNAPETSECVLRPELCQAHKGIARDMDWATHHCLIPHYVYLALTSNLKVGVTRENQIPTRWIDQGAVQAIKLARTKNRFQAGQIEVALKPFISDRTFYQRMLKNQVAVGVDLLARKGELLSKLPPGLQQFALEDNNLTELEYPVREYPTKVKSLSLEKEREIAGRLWGIKGQYLIFDDGRVLNIRKHNGYMVTLEV